MTPHQCARLFGRLGFDSLADLLRAAEHTRSDREFLRLATAWRIYRRRPRRAERKATA